MYSVAVRLGRNFEFRSIDSDFRIPGKLTRRAPHSASKTQRYSNNNFSSFIYSKNFCRRELCESSIILKNSFALFYLYYIVTVFWKV